MLRILTIFLLIVGCASAQVTKVGGSGTTKVGGSGTTKVFAASAATVTATDTFVRANANPISNPMSDGVSTWTTASLDGGTSGGAQIFANLCTGTQAGDCFAVVATPSIGTKQYAQMTVVSQGGSDYDGGVLYAQQGGTSNCYFFYFNGSPTQIIFAKRVSNTNTTLQTWTVTSAVANDLVRVRVDPATHVFTLSINGADNGTTVTDTTYTTGQPGEYCVGSTNIGKVTCGTW